MFISIFQPFPKQNSIPFYPILDQEIEDAVLPKAKREEEVDRETAADGPDRKNVVDPHLVTDTEIVSGIAIEAVAPAVVDVIVRHHLVNEVQHHCLMTQKLERFIRAV